MNGEAKMRMVLPILAAAALASCAPPAPLGPQPTENVGVRLTSDQIRSEVVGNTGSGTRTSTRATISLYVAPDGSLIEVLPTRTETGRWRISDDGFFCQQYPIDFDGKEICFSVHKAGITIEFHSMEVLERLVFQAGKKI
jgi:hypothetical protein